MPYHIKAERAPEKVLVTGDPARVRWLSSQLLESPETLSESRGFPLVRGLYKGSEVAIAAHGIGGPSAAIVAEELRKIGARIVIRLGTAASLAEDLDVGDVVVASGAGSTPGGGATSLYYQGVCPPASPDPLLAAELLGAARARLSKVFVGPVFSSDSFYAEDRALAERLRSLGFLAIEMECYTLFSLSWLRGFKSACILVVSNKAGSHEAADERLLNARMLEAARAALEVLSSS